MSELRKPVTKFGSLRPKVLESITVSRDKRFDRFPHFAAAVKAAGKPVELVEAPYFNHFEILESLGKPYGPNGRSALALMKLSSV